MASILFVSHPKALCGVYDFGLNLAEALRASRKFTFSFVECGSADELKVAMKAQAPAAVIYNHHPSTMGWLSRGLLRRFAVPHVGILHEVTQAVADAAGNELFDFHIAPDPTLLLRNPLVFKTGRLLPSYENRLASPAVPTVGSFGFGTPGKGFEAVVERVQREFDRAIIRLRIPFATFADADGERAREIAARCRALVSKPGITLEIEHDFLSNEQLLDFLAENSLNAFFYEAKTGRGISSAIDYALAVRRPIAVTKSSMFRHVLEASPSIAIEDSSLVEIMARGFAPLARFADEWTAENLVWDYERIMTAVLAAKPEPAFRLPPRLAEWAERAPEPIRDVARTLGDGVQAALGATTPLLLRAKKAVSQTSAGAPLLKALERHEAFAKLRKLARRSPRAQVSAAAPAGDWVPRGAVESTALSQMKRTGVPPYRPVPATKGLNRILDPSAFEVYGPAIDYLFTQMPEMMARKIARANIQQAFVLDTTVRMAKTFSNPKLLCVGSYEDTASAAVVMSGFAVDEVDPVINYDLTTFVSKPTTVKGSYSVVFSTSVIEHVADDESFVRDMETLLAPGGVGVLTCDFNDAYRPGDPLPMEDRRFYTKQDLGSRFMRLLPHSDLVDVPNWDCPDPDFSYGGCRYTFATFVFRKRVK